MRKLILLVLALMLCASALAEAQWPFGLTADSTFDDVAAKASETFDGGEYTSENDYEIIFPDVPMGELDVAYVLVHRDPDERTMYMFVGCKLKRDDIDAYSALNAALDVAINYGEPSISNVTTGAADPFGNTYSTFTEDMDSMLAALLRTPYRECKYVGYWVRNDGGSFVLGIDGNESNIIVSYMWNWANVI